MLFKISSETAARLLFHAVPMLPVPVIRPDISPRQERRLQAKAKSKK